MEDLDIYETREYELPAFAFRNISLKSWNAVGTMVWEYLQTYIDDSNGTFNTCPFKKFKRSTSTESTVA